jgi:hypothetical protein
MRVLVSDTSVLVDLERGGLLERVFDLPCEFVVPDVLYHRELEPYNGAELVRLGLRVHELDGEGVRLALGYREVESTLSLPDALALALAKTGGFTLLTGDGALRALAGKEDVECHGVLWLLDELWTRGVAPGAELAVGLKTIASHPRCRLPKAEVSLRLRKYAG